MNDYTKRELRTNTGNDAERLLDEVNHTNSDIARRELKDAYMQGHLNSALFEEINETIKGHESKLRYSYAADPADRVRSILDSYQRNATFALAGAKHFRDDLMVYFRSMSMIVDMVGNATTHSEKNARLRGLSELIEQVLAKLQKQSFDFDERHWEWYDGSAFRSDYPTRELKERIYRLEAELKEARQQLGQPVPVSDGNSEEASM